MTVSTRHLTCVAALAAMAVAPLAWAIAPSEINPARIEAAEQNPSDWLTYHGGYKSYHYSGLDQINPRPSQRKLGAIIRVPAPPG